MPPATRCPAAPLRRLAVFALVASASTGCYRDSDAFIQRAATLSCINARECHPQGYDVRFAGLRDCRESAEDQLHAQVDPLEDDGCEYIVEKGRECIRTMFKVRMECGTEGEARIESACDAVFVCSDGLPREGIAITGLAVLEGADVDASDE